MLDAYSAELIRKEYHKRLMTAEDFNMWLKQEGERVDLDADTVQEIIKDFLR